VLRVAVHGDEKHARGAVLIGIEKTHPWLGVDGRVEHIDTVAFDRGDGAR
jgi:hypothetical protein